MKICFRENLANEKMVFSQESSQSIFEMDNVELIEVKTSRIQCQSCVRLWLLQGVINTALTDGRNTITKQKTHFGARITSIWDG